MSALPEVNDELGTWVTDADLPERVHLLADRSAYVAPEIASFELDEMETSEQFALTGNT
ncbi:hypothetical protein [Labrys sp. KNU-23]|uniref:hypothetical protein n=1 Tax=Labrys sp. KNU-23 TaxID=2789216 RepID=UPI00165BD770|nr:hypothetical protein [Labrys sp. KNU-23]